MTKGTPKGVHSSAFPCHAGGEPADCWVEITPEGPRLTAGRRHSHLPASRETLDALDEAVVLADDQGRYVDASKAFCDATGFALEEVPALSVAGVTPEASPYDADTLWKKFRIQGAQAGRYMLRLKDGSQRLFFYQAFTGVLPGLHISFLRPL